MFGLVVMGPVSPRRDTSTTQLVVFATSCNRVDDSLDIVVKEFLHTDWFGVKLDATSPVCPDEQQAIAILEITVRYVGGRYEAGLLLKEGTQISIIPPHCLACFH